MAEGLLQEFDPYSVTEQLQTPFGRTSRSVASVLASRSGCSVRLSASFTHPRPALDPSIGTHVASRGGAFGADVLLGQLEVERLITVPAARG